MVRYIALFFLIINSSFESELFKIAFEYPLKNTTMGKEALCISECLIKETKVVIKIPINV